MRTTLNILLILVFLTAARADEFETVYGKGIAHVEVVGFSQVTMYSSPESKVTHTLSITCQAWSLNRTMLHFDSLYQFDSVPSWFKPFVMLTYGEQQRIDFTVLDSANGFYLTDLKDVEGREVWLKRNENIKFLTWMSFYSSVGTISLTSNKTILYDSPNSSAKSTDYTSRIEGRGQMKALEYSGMWMKVELRIPSRDPILSEEVFTGWIQWRNEQTPLVEHNLFGC
jgi:hypothetical protein